MEPMMHESL